MFELLKTFSNGQDLFTARTRSDFGRELASSLQGWAPTVAPVADVIETADALKVLVDIPGFDADSLRIQFENDVLSIEGERRPKEEKGETYLLAERRVGKFSRAFTVNVPVDAERIEAAYDRGVLTVTLLKRPEAKPRKIDVKVK
jgi:HSP20 family protein